MTSRGQCPRGGGCVLVNVFTPPPSGNPVSASGWGPPKALPYFAHCPGGTLKLAGVY